MKKKVDSNDKQRLNSAVANPAATPRRRTLKRLAAGGAAAGVVAGLPTRWTQPVVKSVMLPAHAQLSEEGEQDCTAPPGCYQVGEDSYLSWPGGGPGPFNATLSLNAEDCGEGGFDENVRAVVAARQEEAEELLQCGEFEFMDTLRPSPALDNGCIFYACRLENCLLHGTPVLLPGGRSRSIETLSLGDVVAALDHGTGTTKPAVVTGIVTSHVRDHYWRINESLLITNDHPVLVASGDGAAWRRVDALAEGMEIQGIRGRTTILSLERVMGRAETVYLETTADNFIAAPGGVSYVVKSGYGKASQRRRVETGCLAPA